MVASISDSGLGLLNSTRLSSDENNNNTATSINENAEYGQAGLTRWVNTLTGNLVLQRQDQLLVGLGENLAIARTYNSQGRFNDANGNNFRFSFNSRISQVNGSIMRIAGDGSESVFKLKESTHFTHYYVTTDGTGAHDTLINEAGKYWIYRDGDSGVVEVYDNNGYLRSVTDQQGFTTYYEWDNYFNRVSKIHDASGQVLELVYDLFNPKNVVAIKTHLDGQLVTSTYYRYDAYDRLTKVITDLSPEDNQIDDDDNKRIDDYYHGVKSDNVSITEYEYYHAHELYSYGHYNHPYLVKSVSQSDGSITRFTYVAASGDWRVKTVTSGEGEQAQVVRYDYFLDDDRTDITVVQDTNYQAQYDHKLVTQAHWGFGVTQSVIHDQEGRLAKTISAPDGQGQRNIMSYVYDNDDNLIEIQDGLQQSIQFAYDTQGNVTSEQNSQGQRIERLYDDNNLLLNEIRYNLNDPDGVGSDQAQAPEVKRFVYDEQRRLRFQIASNGEVSEFIYSDMTPRGGQGELDYIVDTVIPEIYEAGQWGDYRQDAWQEPVSLKTIQYNSAYDLAGLTIEDSLNIDNLQAWIDQQSDKQAAQVIVQQFDYRGQLAQEISYTETATNLEGAGNAIVSRFHYDANGQLLQQQVFQSVFDWQNESLREAILNIEPLSGATVSTTQFTYDGLNRLLSESDANGNTVTYNYGGQTTHERGHISSQLANGLLTTEVYDNKNQLISITESDANNSVVDLGSQRYFYDRLGRQIAVQNQIGVLNFTLYDNLNRVVATIDGNGVITQKQYNLNGQLIKETQYAQPLASSSLAAYIERDGSDTIININAMDLSDLNIAENTAEDRTTKYYYDQADQLIFKVDPEDNVVEYRYNGKGDLLTTIAHAELNGAAAVEALLALETSKPLAAPIDYTALIAADQFGVDSLESLIIQSKNNQAERWLATWIHNNAIYHADLLPSGELSNIQLVHEAESTYLEQLQTVQQANGDTVLFWREKADRHDEYQIRYSILDQDNQYRVNNAQLQADESTDFYEIHDFSIAQLSSGDIALVAEVLPFSRDWHGNKTEYPGHDKDIALYLLNTQNNPPSYVTRFVFPNDEQPEPNDVTVGDGLNLTKVLPSADHNNEVKPSIVANNDGGFTISWYQYSFGHFVSQRSRDFYYNPLGLQAAPDDSIAISAQLRVGPERDIRGLGVDYEQYGAITQLGNKQFVIAEADNIYDLDGAVQVKVLSEQRDQAFTQFTIQLPEPDNLKSGFFHFHHNQEQWRKVYESLEIIAFDDYSFQVSWLVNGDIWSQNFDANARATSEASILKAQQNLDDEDASSGINSYNITRLNDNAWLLTWLENGIASSELYERNRRYDSRSPAVLDSIDALQSADNRLSYVVLDEAGRELARIDEAGFMVENHYNGKGQLEQVSAYANAISAEKLTNYSVINAADLADLRPEANENDRQTFSYFNAAGQVVAELDAERYLSVYRYDGADNVLSQTRYDQKIAVPDDQQAGIAALTLAQLLEQVTSAKARTRTATYDALNQLIKEVSYDGLVATFEYNSEGQLTREALSANDEQDPFDPDLSEQRVSTYDYDVQGQLTHFKNPLMQLREETESYRFDLAGRVVGKTDANGNNTTYLYDANAQLRFVVNQVGEVTETQYNAFGEISAIKVFDFRLRPEQVANLGGGLLDATQLATLAPLAESSQATVTRTSYDRRGLITETSDGEDYLTQRAYDQFGDLIALAKMIHKPANGDAGQFQLTQFDNDKRGQLQVAASSILEQDASVDWADAVIVGESITTRQSVDAFGQVILAVDGNGNRLTNTFDNLGRRQSTSINDKPQQTIVYDSYGRQTQFIDALGNTVVTQYDDASLTTTVMSPEGISTRSIRSAFGDVVTVKDAEGNVERFEYDVNGNLKTIINADGSQQQSRYDANNNLLVEIDENGNQTRYYYDVENRLLKVIQAYGDLELTTEYRLDTRGNRVEIVDANNVRSELVFDRNDNLIASVLDGEGLNLKTETEYDGLGNELRLLTYKQNSDELEREQVLSYDAQGRLLTQRTLGQFDDSINYRYDNNDNLSRRDFADGRFEQYFYDDRNLLVAQIDQDGAVISFQYDNKGQQVLSHAYATLGQIDASGELQLPEIKLDQDRIVQSAFNKDGNLIYRLDSEGYVIENIYDKNNVLIGEQRFAVPIADFINQVDGKLLALSQSDIASKVQSNEKDRLTLSLQDARSRPVINVDGDGFISEIQYDSYGNAVATWEYDDSVNAKAILAAIAPGQNLGQIINTYPQAVIVNLLKSRLDFEKLIASNKEHRLTAQFFDAANRSIASIDALGYVNTTTYDDLGNIVETRRFANRSNTLPLQLYLQNNSIPSWQLSDFAPIASADDQIEKAVFDTSNRVIERVAANGKVTEFSYDALDREIARLDNAVSQDEERAKQLTYGNIDVVLTEQRSKDALLDVTVTRQFDAYGRLVAETDGEQNKRLFYFDAKGRITHIVSLVQQSIDGQTAVMGEVEEFSYNLFNELVSSREYAERLEARQWQGGDNAQIIPLLTASALDSTITYQYNRNGYQVGFEDALGNITATAINAFGEVSRISQQREEDMTVVNQWLYDLRGNLVEKKLQEQESGAVSDVSVLERYRFNAFAELITQVNSRGYTATNHYDQLGRLITVTDFDGNTGVKTYDAFGQLLSELDGNGSLTQYKYELSNAYEEKRIIQTLANQLTIIREQNAFGEEIKITGVDGTVVLYSYDKAGNLLAQREAFGTVDEKLTMSEYDNNGALLRVLENGIETVYSYDARGRVLSRTIDPDGLAALTEYEYDAKGNDIIERTQQGLLIRRSYDANNNLIRLTREMSEETLLEIYEYDARNQQSRLIEGYVDQDTGADVLVREKRFTYDANNLQVAATSNLMIADNKAANSQDTAIVDLQFVHDNDGNLTKSIDQNGNATRYFYNGNNEVVFKVDPMGYVTERVYDSAGNNIRINSYYAPMSIPENADLAFINNLVQSNDQKRSTYTVFDELNRELYSVNGEGHVVKSVYDVRGNLVTLVQFAQDFDTGLLLGDNNREVLDDFSQFITGDDRVIRYVYNLLGEQTFKIDPMGYITEFRLTQNRLSSGVTYYRSPVAFEENPSDAQMRQLLASVPALSRGENLVGDYIEQIPQAYAYGDTVSNAVRNETDLGNPFELNTQRVKARNPNQLVPSTISDVTSNFITNSQNVAIISDNASVLGNTNIRFETYRLGSDYPTEALVAEIPELGPEFEVISEGISVNLLSDQFINTYQEHPVFDRLQSYADIKTVLYAAVYDQAGNYLHTIATPLGQEVQGLVVETFTPVDESGEPLVDENGAPIVEERLVPDGAPVWKVAENWNYGVNVSDAENPLAEGQYTVKYYISDQAFDAADPSAHIPTEVITENLTIGVQSAVATTVSWLADSMPQDTAMVRFNYGLSTNGAQEKTLDFDANSQLIVGDDSRSYFQLRLDDLANVSANGNYDYQIEYLDGSGNVLRNIVGQFNSTLGNSSESLSESSVYAFNYLAASEHSMLSGLVPESELETVARVIVNVDAYQLNAEGERILDANGQPLLTVVSQDVITDANTERFARGQFDGSVHLSYDSILTDGQYRIRYEIEYLDGSSASNSAEIDYEIGLQFDEYQVLSWPEELTGIDANSIAIRYGQNGSLDQTTNLSVLDGKNVILFANSETGQYDFSITYLDALDRQTAQATGQFSLGANQSLSVDRFVKFNLDTAEQSGSSLRGYIDKAKALLSDRVEVDVISISDQQVVSSATTYIDPTSLLDDTFSGDLNLSIGSQLADGAYRINVSYLALDGSVLTETLDYTVGQTIERNVALTRFSIDALPIPENSFVVAEYAPAGSDNFQTIQLERNADEWLITTKQLAAGDYQLRFNSYHNDTETLQSRYLATMDVTTDGQSQLVFAESPLSAGAKSSFLLYDAAGRVRFALTDFTDEGRAIVKEIRYTPSRDGMVMETRFYQEAVAVSKATTTEDLAALVDNNKLTLVKRTEASTDALGNYRSISDFVIDENGNEVELITRYQYDSAGNLLAVMDPAGNVNFTQYDSAGRKTATFTTTATQIDASSVFAGQANNFAATDEIEGFYTRYDYIGNTVIETVYMNTAVFDPSWSIASDVLQAEKRITEKRYNANGELAQKTVSEGNGDIVSNEVFAYDAFGNNTSVITGFGSAAQSETRYTFDNNDQRLSKTIAYGVVGLAATTTYRYDNFGQVAATTDSRGNTKHIVFDENSVAIEQVNEQGDSSFIVTDGQGNVLKRTDEKGNTTFYFYTKQNTLRYIVDGDGRVNEYRYDVLTTLTDFIVYDRELGTNIDELTDIETLDALVVQLASSKDRHTHYINDNKGRVLKIIENYDPNVSLSAQAVRENVYDNLGNIVEVKDELGLSVHYLFDAASRLVGEKVSLSQADAMGEQDYYTRYQYNAVGELINQGKPAVVAGLSDSASLQAALANGQLQSSFAYDATGKRVFEASDFGKQLTTEYDLAGNVVKQADANGASRYFFYNARNQRVLSIDPAGFVTINSYDGEGNEVNKKSFEQTLATGLYTDATRQALNANALTALQQKAYLLGADSSDLIQALGLTSSELREVNMTYDGENRLLTTTTSPLQNYSLDQGFTFESLVAQTQYDKAGNVFAETDGLGQSNYYFYDENNELILVVDKSGALTQFVRDNFGNVVQRISYAEALPLNQYLAIEPDTQVETLLASVSTTNARIQEKVFDNYNRLQEEIIYGYQYGEARTDSRLIADYQYTGFSKVYSSIERKAVSATGQQLGSSETELFFYDELGRLTEYRSAEFSDQTGNAVRKTTRYGYDFLNNQRYEEQLGSNGQVIKAHYTDYQGRLKASEYGMNGYYSYTYDNNGNLKTVIDLVNASRKEYTRDSRGLIIAEAVYNTDPSKGSTTNALRTNNYQYNAFKQLAARGINNVFFEQYEYDSLGRIAKTNAGNGVEKLYYYDLAGNNSLEITSQSQNVKTQALNAWFNNAVSVSNNPYQILIRSYQNTGQIKETRRFVPNSQVASSLASLLASNKVVSQSIAEERFEYNVFGDIEHQYDAYNNQTSFGYNVLGKQIWKLNPLTNLRNAQYQQENVRTRMDLYYDGQARQIATKDERGNVTRQSWADDQITLVTRADGTKEQYLFDAVGDLRQSRILANNNTAVLTRFYDYSYNFSQTKVGALDIGQSQQTTWMRFSGGDYDRIVNVFDVDGDVLSRTKSAQVYFDSFNNNKGNVTPTQYFSYDALGRVTETKGFDGTKIQYLYRDLQGLNSANYFSGIGNDQSLAQLTGIEKVTRTFSRGSTSYKQEVEIQDHYGRTHLRLNKGNQQFRLYYNQQGQVTREVGIAGTSAKDWRYTYDSLGRLTKQLDHTVNNRYEWSYDNMNRYTQERYYENGSLYRNTQVTYNALGQKTTLSDNRSGNAISYEYDFAGNQVRVNNNYYSFDQLNRMVVAKGSLSGGSVVRGSNGEQIISYDALGRRLRVETSAGRLDYTYNTTNGNLSKVRNATKGIDLLVQSYWADGRVSSVVQRDNDNKLTTDKYIRYDQFGSVIFEHTNINNDDVKPSDIRYFYDSFGNVQKVQTVSYGDDTNTITQTFGYYYFDEAKTKYTHIQGSTSNSKIPNGDWKDGESRYRYDASGNLIKVDRYETGRGSVFSGGSYKNTISFVTDLQDRILRRTEGSKNDYYYFFAQDNYGQNLNGAKTLDLNYQRIALDKQSFMHTVDDNETLQSIASAFYGDSSLWYLIAQANGIGTGDVQVGQQLVIPQIAINQNSTSDTFKPYDASKAIGDVAPELPEAPPPKKSCVDILLIILVVVVAVIVTVLISVATAGVASAAAGYASSTLGAIAIGAIVGGIGGAIGGFAGSAAAQGVAIGVGLQEEFDWSEVGKSALIGGTVGIFLGGFAGFKAASAAAEAAKGASYSTTRIFATEFARSFTLEFVAESIAQGLVIAVNGEKPSAAEVGLLFAKAAVKGLVSGVSNGAGDALRNVWKSKAAASQAVGTASSSVAKGSKALRFISRNRETVLRYAQDTFKYGAYYTGAVYGFEAAKASVKGEEFDSDAAWLKVGLGLIAARVEDKSSRLFKSNRIEKALSPKKTDTLTTPTFANQNAAVDRPKDVFETRRLERNQEVRNLDRGGSLVRNRQLQLADRGIRLFPAERVRLQTRELARFRQERNAEVSALNKRGAFVRDRKLQLEQKGAIRLSPSEASSLKAQQARELRAFQSRKAFEQRAELRNLRNNNQGAAAATLRSFQLKPLVVSRKLGFDLKSQTRPQNLASTLTRGQQVLAGTTNQNRFAALSAAQTQSKANTAFIKKFYPDIVKFGVKSGKIGFLQQFSKIQTPAEIAASETREQIAKLIEDVRDYNFANNLDKRNA